MNQPVVVKTKTNTKIAPSIAAGDNGILSLEAKRLDEWGADWIHVDIMDGLFAPNITFGPAAVKSIRKSSKLPLDCHLMLSRPEIFCKNFLEAGGDFITVHVEAVDASTLAQIEKEVKDHGAKLGIAFKPSTDLSAIDLSDIEVSLVTIMTVNPGFSGQKLMPEVVPKIKQAKERFSSKNTEIEIEVDGGVDRDNARMLSEQGASVLVAGNAVFGQPDPGYALKELKSLVNSA